MPDEFVPAGAAQALNARLTRVEEQLRSGSFVRAGIPGAQDQLPQEDDDRPPMPDDADAPPAEQEAAQPQPSEAPVGFWTDLVAAVRQELKPPVSGFFVASPNAPIQGVLRGQQLILQCSANFVYECVNNPAVLELVGRKASVKLGHQITAKAVDITAQPVKSGKMEQLLSFGRAHNDIVTIKDN